MGAVYKARQTKLDRLVALKILPRELCHDTAFQQRFAREAKALAKLNHPNIVGIYDFGEAGGYFYFLMEYVDGANLRELLRAGRLPQEEAVSIVAQICEALQYAHELDIVHRDIKPENILLDVKGRVKIADFGLAKLVGDSPADLHLTGSRQVMGTPHYMAPEQMEKPQTVDRRADIYSLGVVFYEMLTNELPLGRFAAPSQKARLDSRLDAIVLRALEKEPEARYQQISKLKAEMDGIAAKHPHHQPSAERWETVDRDALRQRLMVPAAGLILAGLLSFFSFIAIGGIVLSREYPLYKPNILKVADRPVKVRDLEELQAIRIAFSNEANRIAELNEIETNRADVHNHDVLWISGATLLLPFAGAVFLVFGGVQILKMKNYEAAVISSLWAMVPWSPVWPIGLIFGIGAFRALRQPEVYAAFKLKEKVLRLTPAQPQTGKVFSFFRSLRSFVAYNSPAHRLSVPKQTPRLHTTISAVSPIPQEAAPPVATNVLNRGEPAKTISALSGSALGVLFIGGLLLIWVAMAVMGSAEPLWFLLLFGLFAKKNPKSVVFGVATVIGIVLMIALVGYGMYLARSVQPLWALLAVLWIARTALFEQESEDGEEESETRGNATPVEASVHKAMKQASWWIDIHFDPEIPGALLAGSRKNCRVPDTEHVIGVVDLTGNENGDNCLVFGKTALYVHNPSDSGHPGAFSVPCTELAGREFVNHGDSVCLGEGQFLHNSEDAVAECDQLIKLLNKVRQSVLELQPIGAARS
jgi:tRNA A-37 threonylcarbamoyl transferase component Bud32